MSESMSAEEFRAKFARQPAKGAKNKYNVAPKEQRTIGSRTYASKAEMEYALKLQKNPGVWEFVEQPRVQLGPDTFYRPDFLVIPQSGQPYYVDVKGVETPEFRRNKKLWAKYGRLRLVIVKKSGAGFTTVEAIEGSKA